MNSYEQLYWLTRLDTLKDMVWTIFGLSTAFVIIYLIGLACTACEGENSLKNWKAAFKPWKWVAYPLLVINLLLGVFIPNKSDALLIMGAGTVLEYVETNKDLQTLPDKAVEALTEWSDNFLEEQRKKGQYRD